MIQSNVEDIIRAICQWRFTFSFDKTKIELSMLLRNNVKFGFRLYVDN